MLLHVKFEGGLADEHRIPAYDGMKSLEGFSRSILIVSNYLVEGRVRRRDFGAVPLTFNLVSQRPGSFETLLEIAYGVAAIGSPLALGVVGNLLTDLLKSTFRKTSGQPEPENVSPEYAQLEDERPGDIEALVDAIEPAVRRGHTVINHGVINININGSDRREEEPIAGFDRGTKEYMWESVLNNQPRAKVFSIGSFNANQGTGRAFDIDEGRSVPFELVREVDRETIESLLRSISLYTRRRRLGDELASTVALKYTSVDSVDGRIKKIRVVKARQQLQDL